MRRWGTKDAKGERIAERHSRGRLAALLSIAALAAFCAVAGAMPAAAPATIRLGVFNQGAPAGAEANARYTEMVGRQPDIVLSYHYFEDAIMTSSEMATLRATGQTPMVTWEPYDVWLPDIANGDYDAYLRRSARIAAAWGGEMMIRFAHEMNGDWYSWTGMPLSYVYAWRHIVSIFREMGATNVSWVWSPNVDRIGAFPFSDFFPGDAWVDYVALDGYNWGDTKGNHWSSLEDVFSASYEKITEISTKPVIIAEISSSTTGGDKAAWIRNGFMTTIPFVFPRVVGVVWFNLNKEDQWRVDTSEESLNAYREVVNCSYYGGSGPCDPGLPEEPLSVESLHVTQRVRAPSRRPRGMVSYLLSHSADVRIEIRLRRRHGSVRRATLVRSSHAGRTRLPLRRFLGRSGLRSGRYSVTIVARDKHGQRSKPRRADFRVL